jgi:hypothetical protein
VRAKRQPLTLQTQTQDEQKARATASLLFILCLLNVFPHVSHEQTSEFSSVHSDTYCLDAVLHG